MKLKNKLTEEEKRVLTRDARTFISFLITLVITTVIIILILI